MPRLSLDAVRSAASRARKATGSVLVQHFFQQLANTARLHPRADPRRHGVSILKDLPYTDSGAPHHTLDLYLPTHTPPPWPVAFYVHGGGFRILSKDTHWVMGLAFAKRGFLTVNINYRLAPQHPFPAALQDAAQALAWTLDHAAHHSGDTTRLVLAGESAGANLALNLALACARPTPLPQTQALFERAPRIAATIAACGLFEVTNPQRFLQRDAPLPAWVYDRIEEVHNAYLGPQPTQDPDLLDLTSPLLPLERGEHLHRPLSPLFLPCGTADPLVEDQQRLQRALERLGVEHLAAYYPGELHAFHAFLWRPQARACWRDIFAFIDQHLPPPP
jgi:acetyl esterase